MKNELLREQLGKMNAAPFYQCPHCHTVWLITGGTPTNPYTCKTCGHSFNPAQARYVQGKTESDQRSLKLPEAA